MAQLVESVVKPLQVREPKKLSGLFAITGVFNNNGRNYPEEIYSKAFEKIKDKIPARRLIGELDHPTDRDEVFLSNVSHVITECHKGVTKSGKTAYYGTVELLDTPSGKIAQALVKAGIPLGISSRGVGNTRKIPGGVEVTEFGLITYDLVADPSFSSAILSEESKNELAESLDYIESRIPMNESSQEDNFLRDRINSLRESLGLNMSTGVDISEQELQTMEIHALKSLLESKSKVISTDTEKLVKQRSLLKENTSRINKLEDDLSKLKSRYTSIRESQHRLQESYNNLKESYEKELSDRLSEKDEVIAELTKRLAVEKKGMSYSNVCGLLEGLSTESEINARLDSITSMGRRSSYELKDSHVEDLRESLQSSHTNEGKSRLSGIVSRV